MFFLLRVLDDVPEAEPAPCVLDLADFDSLEDDDYFDACADRSAFDLLPGHAGDASP